MKDVTNTGKGKNKEAATFEMIRKPTIERIFHPLSVVKKNLPFKDEELTLNLIDSEASFDVICVVSILPTECDITTEITEVEEDFTDEMEVHKPMCYYFKNNGCLEEHQAMFERPD